eukprot:5252989-Amphidinium_carterae.1
MAAGIATEDFLTGTRRRRWGTAADAVGIAKSFDKGIRIFDSKGVLIVAEVLPHHRGCINLLLRNQHYLVIDPMDVETPTATPLSFYLFRQPGARHIFKELVDLPTYLQHLRCLSSSMTPAQGPAAKPDQDPSSSGGEEAEKNMSRKGREAKSRKDPEGQSELGLTLGSWVGVFSGSFCHWIMNDDAVLFPRLCQ